MDAGKETLRVELSSEEDLANRVAIRQAMKGQRVRVLCKRCGKKIPETRRITALYCSPKCHSLYRREEIARLRTEMRAEARRLLAPTHCQCGTELDNHRPGKTGPIARKCKRCTSNQSSRAYKQRKLSMRQQSFKPQVEQLETRYALATLAQLVADPSINPDTNPPTDYQGPGLNGSNFQSFVMMWGGALNCYNITMPATLADANDDSATQITNPITALDTPITQTDEVFAEAASESQAFAYDPTTAPVVPTTATNATDALARAKWLVKQADAIREAGPPANYIEGQLANGSPLSALVISMRYGTQVKATNDALKPILAELKDIKTKFPSIFKP